MLWWWAQIHSHRFVQFLENARHFAEISFDGLSDHCNKSCIGLPQVAFFPQQKNIYYLWSVCNSESFYTQGTATLPCLHDVVSSQIMVIFALPASCVTLCNMFIFILVCRLIKIGRHLWQFMIDFSVPTNQLLRRSKAWSWTLFEKCWRRFWREIYMWCRCANCSGCSRHFTQLLV